MAIPPAFALIKKAITDFIEEDSAQSAAALSFYAVTAIPPLAVLLTAILGLVYSGPQAAQQLVDQVTSLFGQSTGETIASILERRAQAPNGAAALTGLAVLLLGASGFFVQLQKALNHVWGVKADPEAGWKDMFVKRMLGMTVVLGTGFLLLISLMFSAILAATSSWLESHLGWSISLAAFAENAISLAMITCMFVLMFRGLPDVKIRWSDVWRGALATSLLFLVGKFALGWYLGRTDFTADYGSAGALVLILFWVYYSSMILLFGAKLTRVQAEARGLKVVPEQHAVVVKRTETVVEKAPTKG
jgi:membrane protein